MKIIDNKKDYYDYISDLRGIDEDIIFDRRNKENNLLKYLPSNRWYFKDYEYYLLEIGFIQYLIKVTSKDIILLKKYENEENYFHHPIFFGSIYYKWSSRNKNIESILLNISLKGLYEDNHSNFRIGRKFANPILKECGIQKLIPADEVWTNIYNYLISNSNVNYKDNRTDIQKLESAGFDKIESFRNIK